MDGEVLAERADATVVRVGNRVAKAHDPDAEAGALAVRLGVAAAEPYAGVLLAPLRHGGPVELPGGRSASVWPYGSPVDPADPGAAPWEAAGSLLARLHAVSLPAPGRLPGPLPPMRGPAKAARALARMRSAPGGALAAAARTVEGAWASLPAWCRGEEPPPRAAAVCHGDFHLGQLVRHPAGTGDWHLIDVDDLGLGDPAWDLARPACWYATGLLAPEEWERFLGSYVRTVRAAGFRGGLAQADPWPRLDAPARALTVQSAALGIAKARAADRVLDEAEEACVAACARMAAVAAQAELPAPQGP
ncbi:aminoglycoside phosphotransferase family protein [Streptomyces tubbatahanensis]|uniref:Aminoglycoside phosphotransferase family protein n=2 Tax=Streptomyces tubbatahanensis TaxID=2923272 RepID=A0ABY3Y262_9ACTN|nr:aminoglycoside phosphotransferase family protein [Streptomyces tubbatahanensis]UNT00880.1 aminoglycoside phosphotransferase family protein [Streptomyces tubbatahanensis]